MTHDTHLPDDVRLIDDLHLDDPHVIATHVLLGDRIALVDPGPATVLPVLEAELGALGLTFNDVETLLLTHIHLDHAGATGTLVSRYPHLRVYVHQRGAPHLINPEKLLNSATRLYGAEMERLWGEFLSVPEANIATLAGGETLALGTRTLRIFDTPGHASHHVAYFDEHSGALWVGDTAGARLPGSDYVRPASPPPDIDIEAWDRSLDLFASLNPSVLLLTHFGPGSTPDEHIASYRERLHRWAETVRVGFASGADENAQIERLWQLEKDELGDAELDLPKYQHATALEQSWQGLARYWRKANQPPVTRG